MTLDEVITVGGDRFESLDEVITVGGDRFESLDEVITVGGDRFESLDEVITVGGDRFESLEQLGFTIIIASCCCTLHVHTGIGMGNEVANVTDGVARLQVAAQQANQSLDDLLSRLERIRGRLTVAQTAYRTANFCCESLRLDVCPNNNNLVRLSTPSSFIRFDSGHSGAQPFDFNGDL